MFTGQMTEKQLNYLSVLTAERDPENLDVRMAIVFCKHPGLTSKQAASDAISAMLKLPKLQPKKEEEESPQPLSPVTWMLNSFTEPANDDDVSSPAPDNKKVYTLANLNAVDIGDGFYDLYPLENNDDKYYRFFKVSTKPGHKISSVYVLTHTIGGKFKWKEVGWYTLKSHLLKRINSGELSSVAEAKLDSKYIKIFGKKTGVCFVCGRTLTDEKSIADGIGPICAGKKGLF